MFIIYFRMDRFRSDCCLWDLFFIHRFIDRKMLGNNTNQIPGIPITCCRSVPSNGRENIRQTWQVMNVLEHIRKYTHFQSLLWIILFWLHLRYFLTLIVRNLHLKKKFHLIMFNKMDLFRCFTDDVITQYRTTISE